MEPHLVIFGVPVAPVICGVDFEAMVIHTREFNLINKDLTYIFGGFNASRGHYESAVPKYTYFLLQNQAV